MPREFPLSLTPSPAFILRVRVDVFWQESEIPGSSLLLASYPGSSLKVPGYEACLLTHTGINIKPLKSESSSVSYVCEWQARTLNLPFALPSSLRDVASGHGLVVYTDQPGVQLYTGNFLDGSYVGKDGVPIGKHAGVCLETQAWPNAINNPVRNTDCYHGNSW